jgi:hypothetical protein
MGKRDRPKTNQESIHRPANVTAGKNSEDIRASVTSGLCAHLPQQTFDLPAYCGPVCRNAKRPDPFEPSRLHRRNLRIRSMQELRV